MKSLLMISPLLFMACLSEQINGSQIHAAAFSDSPGLVNILEAGGTRWTDVDIWVAWSGPATLRSSTGYVPCKNKEVVAKNFAKRDPKRQHLLQQTADLLCQEKPGKSSGRQFVSHNSGVHWWRAWDRS